ncbi:hypothetical protein A3718_13895 [Erythrobacter sp. HI0019]|nr:hypothetical protein A3718_13895 [Erythrobacter sp. HI0019]KZY09459.1 hypothetical protein A3723_09760 [Erythrobacter sp. HI0028]
MAVLGLWREGLPLHETTEYGLEVHRVPTMVRRWRNSTLMGRFRPLRQVVALLSLIQYSLACIAAAKRLRPDHISCHNAAVLPFAWAATLFSGAKLEYLPHELETQRTGLNGISKRITAIIERWFIRSSSNIVVVCDPIRDWYRDTYGLTNVHVVRNVPEKDAVGVHPIPEGGFRERFNIPDEAKVFIYQGLFSAGRGIEILIKTFSQLAPERCQLVLMGYGDEPYQEMINEAARQYTNIHCQPAVAREWIVSYSAGADVGIFISERASLSYRYALPNKFFEWAHAGLPILVSDNLEYQASLLQQAGFGWAARLEDLTSMVQQISETDLTPFAQNARRYASTAIWEDDAKAFAQIYRGRTARKDEQDD